MKYLYKAFLITLFLLGAYANTLATEITVSSQQVPNVQTSVTSLRIFCNRAFITSDGKPIQQSSPDDGTFYLSVPVSMVGTTATIASFTLDSTTNGRNFTGARYSAFFYDADGNKVAAYQPFSNFAVPPLFDSGTTATWTQIAVFNTSAVPIFTDLSTYSRTEIDAKLAAVNGLVNPLTTLGDIIVAGSGGSLMRLPGNSTTTKNFYTSTGTGSAANQVSLGALAGSDITTALTYTPVNKAGDTLTGFLTLHANPTNALHAATKQYVDSAMGGMGTLTSINADATGAQTFTVNTGTFPTLTITDNASGDHKFGLSGPIGVAQGGTNKTSFTTGSIPYASASTTIAELAIGAAGTVVKSNGSIPVYGLVDLTANVTGTLPSGNGGTNSAFFAVTGPTTSTKTFTFPNASATVLTTNSAVTAVQGGTGQTSYTVGDILYADTTTTLARRSVGGANTVLHGGTTPSYSAVDLANDTTGTLTVAKGGSGAGTFTSGAYLKGAGTSAFTVQTTPLPIADLIASPTTNGVVYNGAGALAVTSVGATGTVLIGTTASAPSFSASPVVTAITLSGLTQDSIPFVGTAGLITQNNARLAWDNSNFRLNIQGTLRLKGSSAGQTGFVAPATVTGGSGTVIYVLPAADGTNGQALVTDGAGNLSWSTLSGGGGGSGITSLNGLTASIQTLTITTSGANSPTIDQPSSSQNRIIIPLAGNSITAGLISNASQTIYGEKSFNDNVTLMSGTTTEAPLTFTCSSCALLTTPVAGSVETDGQFLYYTQSVPSTARKTLAYTDSSITDGQLSANVQLKSEKNANNGYAGLNSSGFLNLAQGGLGVGLTIGTSGTFLRSDGSVISFSADGSALTSLNASNISSGTLNNARLSGVELTANKGAASGYAPLNGSTLIDAAYTAETLTVAQLLTYNGVSGSGTTAIASTITTPADGQYLAYNGSTNNWENRNFPASSTHNLLDGVTHPDTIAQTVTRGALIVGNSTPKWSALTIGAANTSVISDGTDAAWGFVNINSGTTGTLAATRGGTGLTSGTSGGLLYFNSATTIASSAALTSNAILYGAGAGNAPATITNNATATRKFVTQVSSGAPSYEVLVNGDVAELLAVTDLSTYATESGTGTTAIRATLTSLTTNDVLTWNGTNWINQAVAGGSSHDILSATHTDTLAGTVARGDIIVANSTPKWARVAIDGSNRILTNNGTDTAWGKVDLTSSNYITGILPPTNGGTNNAFFQVSGPATSTKTFTFPNASANVLTDNAAVTGAQGGTGVVNTGKTITLGGNLVTSGASSLTFTTTGATNVTVPTTGTLATLTGTEALTNKTFGNTTTFETKDTLFLLQDDADASKKLAFQLSGITTANTRTLTVPDASGTLALTSNNLSAFAATTSAQLAGIISDETGSGALVFGTSPSFTTPTLGAASATTINGLTITSTTGGTLTLANSSSLVTSGANSITLTSTGATNVTLPTTGTLVNSAVTTLSSLVSVGTITTGTWSATAIAVDKGGTNTTSYTKGDILVASAATTLTKRSVGSDGQILVADSTEATGVKWATGGGMSALTDDYLTTEKDITPTGGTFTTSASGGTNTVYVIRFTVTRKMTISTVHMSLGTGSVGNNLSFGIYSNDGNTKLVDSGAISTTSTGIKSVTLGSPVTIDAGVYLFAYATQNTTMRYAGFTGLNSTAMDIANADVTVFATAANSASSGSLPSTTGALTPVNSGLNPMWVKFQN